MAADRADAARAIHTLANASIRASYPDADEIRAPTRALSTGFDYDASPFYDFGLE